MGNKSCGICADDFKDEVIKLDKSGISSQTGLKQPSTTYDRRRSDAATRSPRVGANTSQMTRPATASNSSVSSWLSFMKKKETKAQIADKWTKIDEESSSSRSSFGSGTRQNRLIPEKEIPVDSDDKQRVSRSFDSSVHMQSMNNNNPLLDDQSEHKEEEVCPDQTLDKKKKSGKCSTPDNRNSRHNNIKKIQELMKQAVLDQLNNSSSNDTHEDEEDEDEDDPKPQLPLVPRPHKGKKLSSETKTKLELYLFNIKKHQHLQWHPQLYGYEDSQDTSIGSHMLKSLNIQNDQDDCFTELDLNDINPESGEISGIRKSSSSLFFKPAFGGIGATNNAPEGIMRERLSSQQFEVSDKESMILSDYGAGPDLSSARQIRRLILQNQNGMTTDDQGIITNYEESAATDNNDMASMLKGLVGNEREANQLSKMVNDFKIAKRAKNNHSDDTGEFSFSEQEKSQNLESMIEAKSNERDFFGTFNSKLGAIPSMMRFGSAQDEVKNILDNVELDPISELPGFVVGEKWSNSPRATAMQESEYPMPVRQNVDINIVIEKTRMRRDSLCLEKQSSKGKQRELPSSDEEQKGGDSASTSQDDEDCYMTDIVDALQHAILSHKKERVSFEPIVQKLPSLTKSSPYSGPRMVLRPQYKEDRTSSESSMNQDVAQPFQFKSKSKRFLEKKKKTNLLATSNASSPQDISKGGSGVFAPYLHAI